MWVEDRASAFSQPQRRFDMIEDSTEDGEFDALLRRLAQTPDVSTVNRTLRPGTVLAHRFELEQQLGKGGMGRVFAAYDRRRATRVALKVLGTVTPQAVVQIKHEFRIAAELDHQSLVRLHELFCDGLEWFFTMDLIDGSTLDKLIDDGTTLSAARVRLLFRQLALALRALHAAGTLHGDLKPSNVVITPDDQLVLLDFGLARPVSSRQGRLARAGTRGYMSPEQCAGGELSAATDWYSFGVVLHEVLTGQLPAQPKPAPFAHAELRELSELSLALLARDASARPDGARVLSALGTEASADMARMAVRSSSLVGRTRELSLLRATFHAAIHSCVPAVALVHGCSGIGKTTLVQHFVREVREDGALVLHGRCRERESVGHKAVDVLIDDLVSWLDGLPEREAAALIPPGVGDLTRLFPALRAATAVAREPRTSALTVDQSLARLRAIGALTELLTNLAARAPLVIWIDDLQWADAESAQLLGPILSKRDAVCVMLVGSYRSSASDPRDHGPLLQTLYHSTELHLPSPCEISLSPLSAADSIALARGLLPRDARDAERLAQAIACDAAGHPLFVTELAQAQSLDAEAARPLTLTALMQGRTRALPGDARALIEVMALAGAPLSRAVVRIATALSPERVERALDTLRSTRLVRTAGMQEDSDLDLLHDRIREIIAQDFSDQERRSRHFALARALQSQVSSRPELVATHFEAAGALREAGVHYLIAADRAADNLAFLRAAQLYELGARYAELHGDARHGVLLREARMLALAGRGAEAGERYLRAAHGRPSDQALQLRRLAAEQFLVVGHLDRGLQLIDEVLVRSDLPGTRSGWALLGSVLLGRARVRARGLRCVERSERELTTRQLERIDAAWAVASMLGSIDVIRGVDMQSTHLLLALEAGEPRRLLRALALELTYCAASSDRGRIDQLLAMVERLASQEHEHSAKGMLALLRGLADYLGGRVVSARTHLADALVTFDTHCTGAVWETVSAHRFLIASLFYLGHFAELSRRVPTLLTQATAQGNLYATTTFRTHFSTIAWLTVDDVAEARRQLALARAEWTSSEFELPRCSMFVSEVYIALYTGQPELAFSLIEQYWPALSASHILKVSSVYLQLWYLRGVCALGASKRALASGRRRTALAARRQAQLAARRLAARRLPLAQPLQLLLLASLHAAEGKRADASRCLASSIEASDRLGLGLFAATARMRLARLDMGRARLLENQARAAFAREQVTHIDRMLDLLGPS